MLIDGKALAKRVKDRLRAEIAGLRRTPQLAVILVGDDPASHVYVNNKIKACNETGIINREIRLPQNVSQDDVADAIRTLNADRQVDGILLQLPLPRHIDSAPLIELIDPAKDVDGLTTHNMGRLMAGSPLLVPCTPQGSLQLIQSVEKNIAGLHAVVIGRSLLFGKPMGQLLLAADCTVTQAHSKTRDLPGICAQADILIAAVGRAHLVQGHWVKEGAIVIDVGINRLENGKLTGDVDTQGAEPRARAITPVPGGVGPMTIACLMENTVTAARARQAP